MLKKNILMLVGFAAIFLILSASYSVCANSKDLTYQLKEDKRLVIHGPLYVSENTIVQYRVLCQGRPVGRAEVHFEWKPGFTYWTNKNGYVSIMTPDVDYVEDFLVQAGKTSYVPAFFYTWVHP